MLTILHEDNHLLVVNKPYGLVTMGSQPSEESVLDRAKEYIRQKYNKPGNVYLGVVSRLDAPVTGVLLFARTSKAASRLTDAFRTRQVDKRYLAVVAGEVHETKDLVVHHLKKDDRNQRMYATRENDPKAQRAELRYRVLLSTAQRSLLEIRLMTGRKHQIRVQLSKLGWPIVGDTKYGSEVRYDPGIALHSWRLELEHPVLRETLQFQAPQPKPWARWMSGRIDEAVTKAGENPHW